MTKPYVNFTSSGITVDIFRYLKTSQGKEALRKCEESSKRFERPPVNKNYSNILRLNDFYVKNSKTHGKGVFASVDIPEDSIFYVPYIKILKKNLENHPLQNYAFYLSDEYSAIMGEFGGFINHSDNPNVVACYMPESKNIQEFRLLRNVKVGEEILLNYGLWAKKKWK